MSVHWFSTDPRNACLAARDPRSTGTHDSHRVTCTTCIAAIRAFEFAEAETAKSIPAVTRRMPLVAR